MSDVPSHVPSSDLTAKARIRNSALTLFARNGVEGTSLRGVAADAGVTVGLIVHHYGTKEALREAVELAIVDQFRSAIETVPLGAVPAEELASARDAAVARMLAANRSIVAYLRRSLLDDSAEPGDLLTRLARLAATQVTELRETGVVSTRPTVGEQVITMIVRQLGELLLQPLVDRLSEEFATELAGRPAPTLVVHMAGATPTPRSSPVKGSVEGAPRSSAG